MLGIADFGRIYSKYARLLVQPRRVSCRYAIILYSPGVLVCLGLAVGEDLLAEIKDG
jgi:hypothetical protein